MMQVRWMYSGQSNVFVKSNEQSKACFGLCHGEKTKDEIQLVHGEECEIRFAVGDVERLGEVSVVDGKGKECSCYGDGLLYSGWEDVDGEIVEGCLHVLVLALGEDDEGGVDESVREEVALDDGADVVEDDLTVVGIERGGKDDIATTLDGDVKGGCVGGDGDGRGERGCEDVLGRCVLDVYHCGFCFLQR